MGILSELEVNPSADLPSAMPPQRHASSSYSDDLDHHAGQTHESSSGEKRARGSIACDICREFVFRRNEIMRKGWTSSEGLGKG